MVIGLCLDRDAGNFGRKPKGVVPFVDVKVILTQFSVRSTLCVLACVPATESERNLGNQEGMVVPLRRADYIMKRTKLKGRKIGIKTSSAKAKGRNLQKYACAKIAEVTGFEWGKDKPIESRPMGQMGVDVRMEQRVRELFPFSVECKREEKWSVPAYIRQAKANQTPDTDWLLIMKRSNEDPVVVMDAERFFDGWKVRISLER